MTRFLFGIHCHQPVGNFDHVVTEAIDRCYRPFLETLQRFPDVKCVVHFSGSLLDFIDALAPDLLDLLGVLVEAGQVEILGGGYYEPILTLWPAQDQERQLAIMNEKIASRFESPPRGAWLAERVWEPHLATVLARAGLEATFLDDFHFLAAGMTGDEIHGRFITSSGRETLTVFPINKDLRYLIPFKPVEQVKAFFAGHEEGLLTMVDDGEKFGVWPGTYGWVYREKWLQKFFTFLSEEASIRTVLLSEALEEKPRGRAYLPTASYEEMEEWTLPSQRQVVYHDLKERETDSRYAGLIRGGFFRGFLAKYDESHRMVTRCLQAGEGLEADDPLQRPYLEAQCNCAYWHGIFGGLYLPHLRHGIFTRIVEADRATGSPSARGLRNGHLHLFFSEEGTVEDLYDYDARCNWGGTLRRRVEGYHLLAGRAGAGGEGEGRASIHDAVKPIPESVQRHIRDDAYPSDLFRDLFLTSFDPKESLAAASPVGDVIGKSVESIRLERKKVAIRMKIDERVFTREFTLKKSSIRITNTWKDEPFEGTHLLLSHLLVLDGQVEVEGTSRHVNKSLKGRYESVTFNDTALGRTITFRFDEPLFCLIAPVKTVSLSERGYDTIRQSVAFMVDLPGTPESRIQILFGGSHV